eukprot:Gb_15196 [translate_table: standard]
MVGHLGDAYQEWVHQPIACKEGPRFFESDFWESLTRTVWWVIPLVWLPVVSWTIFMAVQRGLSPGHTACAIIAGIFLWSLMEYSLHRFLFHIKTSSYWANTLHYLLHGCHHKHPMDGYRLVFPPAGTAILCIPFWNLVKLIMPYAAVPALFAGGLLGYVMYDVTHYYLHHGHPSQMVARSLKVRNKCNFCLEQTLPQVKFQSSILKRKLLFKKYHLNHHFRIQTSGYGITSSLWDWVFGTLPPKKV